MTITNIIIMKSLKYCENYRNVTQRHKVSKRCWKNGAYRLAQRRFTKTLQFVKNTTSEKRNKAKHNKTRYACTFGCLVAFAEIVMKYHMGGTSLVAQWLRIRLPMQGTWVRALVREDPTCHGATKPVCHNY